jgi:sulfur relay (sulfurtransferase) complex TusBCD TusD component (DsrE family)
MSANYQLIVSEDPVELPAARRASELAVQLKHRGHTVSLFLVQNGVLSARANAAEGALAPALAAAVEVLADDFSLRERGIELNELRTGVAMSPIDVIVSRLALGWKVLWS